MDTNCAPLGADLVWFCYEREFIMSLSGVTKADIIEAFYSSSRYLNEILNIDNLYFEGMVTQIYPTHQQLNKANSTDTEAAFLDLHLFISANGFDSSKTYDKRDRFDFDIVNFTFLDGDFPRGPCYDIYIFSLFGLQATDVKASNKTLTTKLRQQGYRQAQKSFLRSFIVDTTNWSLNTIPN